MVVNISSLDSLYVIGNILARDPGGLVASPWVQMQLLHGMLHWVGGAYWGAFDVRDPTHPVRAVNELPFSHPMALSARSDTLFLSTLSDGLFSFIADRLSSVGEKHNHNRGGNLQLDIYPNPVNGRFHVTVLAERDGHLTIDIYDVLGRHVRSIFEGYANNKSEWDIDIGAIATGVYFLHVDADAIGRTKKIIVVK
jgi:hypothetical protein